MYLSKVLTILMTVISVSAFAQNSKMKTSDINKAIATYQIGENYFYGKTVKKDLKKGIIFMEEAANNGYSKAQLNLSRMYLRGYKVRKNYRKAFHWAKESAKQNNAEAQYYLALMYIEGKGVSRNIKKGIHWMLKSKSQGYAKAEQQWNKLEKHDYNS